ncbi:FtsQ-type POTRA domain-containing protein [Parashewanella spongiae]|uniref:Cell division protein FtsQ n=1 Tax=Parashewanella spongiae TaxID=342950 RepID=A0A3A6TKI0_9GAMM|nr:FtsQ-type POTRA domain-containing protein [Parashewanella spongiae]
MNWYFCCGLVFLLSVIIGLSAAGWKLNRIVNDAKELPIEAVVIKGERKYTSDLEIQLALQGLLKSSFFSADVSEIQKTLETLPWVYRASVQREWPAKLKVFIKEQDVAAHWNGNSWLNRHGDVFEAVLSDESLKLPSLSGPEGMAKNILTTYEQLAELLKINGLSLNQLSLTPRHAWNLLLDNGIQLDLGREDKISRVQRFIDVYPYLKEQDKAIARIDLRYDTGLAVGWAQTQSESR